MIVKKMPILQAFPPIDSVKKLSNCGNKFSDNNIVFYDIETTGLSRNRNEIYLIGAVRYENTSWTLTQWMTENTSEEKEMLIEFSSYLGDTHHTIQYNGKRFDQPFLETRYVKYDLPSPFQGQTATDVFQEISPFKTFLKMTHLRQTDVENLLSLEKRSYIDGGECINLYRSYLKKPSDETAKVLLGHNEEDLLGLGRIFPLTGLKDLYIGKYTILHTECFTDQIRFDLKFEENILGVYSNGTKEFYLTVSENQAKLLLPLTNGKLKQFFPDFKNYDYIPGEDQAIPKVLSRYMERALRIPATAETCYTWVPCTDSLLNNQEQQMKYLKHTLPCLIDSL